MYYTLCIVDALLYVLHFDCIIIKIFGENYKEVYPVKQECYRTFDLKRRLEVKTHRPLHLNNRTSCLSVPSTTTHMTIPKI